MTVSEIEDKAFFLNDEDKQNLIDRLQDSLNSSTAEPPDWHGDILAERLKKIEAGEAKTISHEEFLARMETRSREARLSR